MTGGSAQLYLHQLHRRWSARTARDCDGCSRVEGSAACCWSNLTAALSRSHKSIQSGR